MEKKRMKLKKKKKKTENETENCEWKVGEEKKVNIKGVLLMLCSVCACIYVCLVSLHRRIVQYENFEIIALIIFYFGN